MKWYNKLGDIDIRHFIKVLIQELYDFLHEKFNKHVIIDSNPLSRGFIKTQLVI